MQKSIDDNLLKKTREEMKITLDDISDVLKIRVCYLKALEEEDWQALPERVYAIGFLKSYASYLNLDYSTLIQKLIEFYDQNNSESSNEKLFSVENLKEKRILHAISNTTHSDVILNMIISFLIKNKVLSNKYDKEYYKSQIFYMFLMLLILGCVTFSVMRTAN